jgi:hypothetical protein
MRAVDENEAHLQEHLEPRRDRRGVAVAERLGAITTLQEEPLATRCLRQLCSKALDLERGDERGQLGQVLGRALQFTLIGVGDPLGGRPRLPGCR